MSKNKKKCFPTSRFHPHVDDVVDDDDEDYDDDNDDDDDEDGYGLFFSMETHPHRQCIYLV